MDVVRGNPFKRRKLETPNPINRRTDLRIRNREPAWTPERVEEVHLHIESRAVGLENSIMANLQRRDGPALELTVPSNFLKQLEARASVSTTSSVASAALVESTATGTAAVPAVIGSAISGTTNGTQSTSTGSTKSIVSSSTSSSTSSSLSSSSSSSTSTSTSSSTSLSTTSSSTSTSSTSTSSSSTSTSASTRSSTSSSSTSTSSSSSTFSTSTRSTTSSNSSKKTSSTTSSKKSSTTSSSTLTTQHTNTTTTDHSHISTQRSDITSTEFKTKTKPTPHSQTTVTSVAVIPPGHSTVTASVGLPSNQPTLQQDNANSTSHVPPPGTIAGGVVGGAAGLAVILVVAMVFLRWYRRRKQQHHLALAPSSTLSPEPYQPSVSSGPGMAERAGMRPLAAAIPGFLRHQGTTISDSTTSPSSERGFQRVSGRKLPSAFSGGMESPPRPRVPPPRRPERPDAQLEGFGTAEGVGYDRNMSIINDYRDGERYRDSQNWRDSGSHYRDSIPPAPSGFNEADNYGYSYGHDAQSNNGRGNGFGNGYTGFDFDVSPIEGSPIEEINTGHEGSSDGGAGDPTLSPGPQRQPTVHRSDVVNPFISASNSYEAIRSGRFTEEV